MSAAELEGTGPAPVDGAETGAARRQEGGGSGEPTPAGTELSRLGEEMFPLLGFLLVSARNLYDEPTNYGPRRLMDAARWLLSINEGEGLGKPFLVELRQALDAHRYGNSDDEALREFLDQACLRYARELVDWVEVTPAQAPGDVQPGGYGHPAG